MAEQGTLAATEWHPRTVSQGTVAPIDAPQALSLRIEPKANAARYDGQSAKSPPQQSPIK